MYKELVFIWSAATAKAVNFGLQHCAKQVANLLKASIYKGVYYVKSWNNMNIFFIVMIVFLLSLPSI